MTKDSETLKYFNYPEPVKFMKTHKRDKSLHIVKYNSEYEYAVPSGMKRKRIE